MEVMDGQDHGMDILDVINLMPDVEFYYKAGDDLYTRFLEGTSRNQQFAPDSTDPTRGGLA